MASEIRVDKITSLSGVGTISPSSTGVEIAGITTVATLKATTGIVTSLAGNKISLGDNAEIYIGVGSDLKLTHDSNNSIITNSTGELLINSPIINLRDSSNNSRLRVEPAGNIDIAKNVNVVGITTVGGDFSIADKIIHTGDTNTAIKFPEADHISFEVGLTGEAMRIDNGGKLLIGLDDRRLFAPGHTSKLQIEGTSSTLNSSLSIVNNEAGTGSPSIRFGKTRGTSIGSNTSVANGDNLGQIIFYGADGTDIYNATALIGAKVNGTVGTDTIPTDLVFETSATTGSGRAERLRILSSGGLTFNGDTATANALDDYEEGDWTPTYDTSGASGSITVNAYAVQYGKYVKIGKVVYVEGLLRANVTNNSNGTYDIGGLPFTVANTPNASGILHGKEQSSWTVAPHHFSCIVNTTRARARGGIDVGDNAYTNANTSGFNSGATNNNRIYIAGWYRVEG